MKLRNLALCSFGAALLFLSAAKQSSAAGEFVLLVNRTNAVVSLSPSELKRLATGATKQWGNGAVVQLGIIPSMDAPETKFFAALIDMTPREFFSRIQGEVFKGEMRKPVQLHSSADCAALAGSGAGAFCACSSSTPVPDTARVVPIK